MKDVQKAIRFTMTLLISCILCVLAGEKLHSAPVFLLVLLAYAIGANFYLLWKAVSKDD